MEQEKDADWRRVVFAGYQVNKALMDLANPDAVFGDPTASVVGRTAASVAAV